MAVSMKKATLLGLISVGLFMAPLVWAGPSADPQTADVRVSIQWDQEGAVSTTVPSVTLIPYPPARKGRPLHESAMTALKSLDARYARILPYCTHPRLSIAELRPPTKDRTFWDFSLIDPEITDFLQTTQGREPTLDFGPIPHWMLKGGEGVTYDSDPDKADWSKCGGAKRAELIDPTGQQVADYFARIASWYTQGGFTDELGRYHASGYHYEIPWWGVLNEPEAEYQFTAEQYTRIYDSVVAAVRKVSPTTKFRGMELASAGSEPFAGGPKFIEYFLDPHHHAPGTPIDMVSFHFVVGAALGQSFDSWQYTTFDQLSRLIAIMTYVDAARNRLAPRTLVNIGELFFVVPEDGFFSIGREPIDTAGLTPKSYWNLAAAAFAYAFIELAQQHADVLTASQLIGYPPQMIPSAGLIDLKSGAPRPELRVIEVLNRDLGTSRTAVHTEVGPGEQILRRDIAAQAFRTEKGGRLLMVNKRSRTINVLLESTKSMVSSETVDERGVTQQGPKNTQNTSVTLRPFAVALIAFQ
jgi:hypothetical protein